MDLTEKKHGCISLRNGRANSRRRRRYCGHRRSRCIADMVQVEVFGVDGMMIVKIVDREVDVLIER